MCFEDDRNKRRVTTRIHCIEWSMRRIIVTYHLVRSTLWMEKFFPFSFFFLLSSVRSYQIGLFSTTMRIFSGSGIEKSDLLRIEWKQVVEFDRKREKRRRNGNLRIFSTAVQFLSSVFYEQKRTRRRRRRRRRLNATRLDKREREKRNSPDFLSSPSREL